MDSDRQKIDAEIMSPGREPPSASLLQTTYTEARRFAICVPSFSDALAALAVSICKIEKADRRALQKWTLLTSRRERLRGAGQATSHNVFVK